MSSCGIPERIREHYRVERELADRLRHADKEARRTLYSELYDELYRRLPHHPQLTKKASAAEMTRLVGLQMVVLKRFIEPGITFMEIGPGDCSLSFHVAGRVRRVFGIDVSDEITKCAAPPKNFELTVSDGTSIPVPPGTIDVAYSNQLMEHLHPDDAVAQLVNIRNALAPNGTYVCITPSRLTGPHDVSRYFDSVATGFHLKEYSIGELARLFRKVGFKRLRVGVGHSSRVFWIPTAPVVLAERILEWFPAPTRRRLARSVGFRWMLRGCLAARR